MANYTETQLMQMVEALPNEEKPRPRAIESGIAYLTQPDGERSYKAVTSAIKPKSDGNQPTDARVAVYIREFLTALGLTDEAPRPGRTPNGGNGPTGKIAPVTEFEQMVANAVEQYRAQVSSIETRLTELDAAVGDFDPEAYRAEVAEEFEQQIAELTARLTAWQNDEGNVATQSTEKFLADLTKRRDSFQNEAEKTLAAIRPQLEQAEATYQTMIAARDIAGEAAPSPTE
jgi:hypothetical protein